MKRFYLDHNATTSLDPRVLEVMLPWMTSEMMGNPSSVHHEGRKARAAIDFARERLASLMKIKPSEIIFSGGGTESNNLAIFGLARAHSAKGRHLITSAGEHHAVLHAFEYLQKHENFEVTILPLSPAGSIDPLVLERAIRKETILVSILSSNNETGVLSPMLEIGAICAKHGIYFHTDAVQSAGKEPLKIKEWQVTAMSLTGHKFYGPHGTGLLYLKVATPLQSLHLGGAQENQRRPGTETVAGIVGFVEAYAIAQQTCEKESKKLLAMTEELWKGISDLPGVQRNGDPINRLSNTLNVSFSKHHGEELLMGLDLAGIAVSSGSACMVGSVQSSHVLQAMGISESTAQSTVRFSMGRKTEADDIPEIISRIRNVILSQRPLYS
ncbi:MAG: cysteine desulfurase family protein [Verrucomicrobiota bacterium]